MQELAVSRRSPRGVSNTGPDGDTAIARQGSKVLTIPTGAHHVLPTDPRDLHRTDLNSMVGDELSVKAHQVIHKTKNVLGDTVGSAKSLLSTAVKAGQELLSQAGASPVATTSMIGGVAVVSLFKGVRNLIHGFKGLMDHKSDPNVSWLMRVVQSGLQFGLTWVCASPFFGFDTPFTRYQDGKRILPLDSVLGAVLAPMFFGSFINTADGISPTLSVPGLGSAWGSICRNISQGIRALTTWGPHHSGAEQGAAQAA